MKKFIHFPVINISYLFLLMLSLYHSNLSGQDFENGDFQSTSSCGSSGDCEGSIECIDGWWYWASFGSPIQDFAWASPFGCWMIDPGTVDYPCSINGSAERGLWMQDYTGGSPNSPHQYVTLNPYY